MRANTKIWFLTRSGVDFFFGFKEPRARWGEGEGGGQGVILHSNLFNFLILNLCALTLEALRGGGVKLSPPSIFWL